MNIKILLSLFLGVLLLGNGQYAKAVDADMIVALDGSGDFAKIQDAIDAVPANQTDRRTVIFIKNGIYDTEKLIIPSNKLNVTFIGESRDQTIISYHIYDCDSPESGNKCPAADAGLWTGDNIRTSATLTIMGAGFRAENMTIRNTAGPVGQALALTIQADKTVFINCDILGYQDTIYLWTAGKRSYFEGCLVLGRTDYIYGAGIAFFETCEIRSYGGGWITAPSTPKSQAYGYVFNNCDLTYATGSPRNGDDGALVRFGRPWHEYPKVTWLNCDMTEKIHPEGWGDTWNMDYAATSADLHLYEYNNTGTGADMSGRANWVGIKALNETEAAEYTPAKVLNGSDGWAPYEEPPLVTTYTWDGGGSDAGWLTTENWNPDGAPATAEVANVEGDITIEANGGTFAADLNLKSNATLNVTANSTAAYITGEKATISSSNDVSLSGKIATKDTITFDVSSTLTLSAALSGVHTIYKNSAGILILNSDNTNFSGLFDINDGTLNAATANSLGKGSVKVANGATLKVDDDNAIFPEASLKVVDGATLNLNASVTLSEFYINGAIQGVSTYDATTNPGLITGTGSIVVGRPSSFTFSGGNWDDISGYSPALLPEAGETVFCEGEMETTSTTNPANIIFVDGKGKLRLRGSHQSSGTLTFQGNQRINYATGGTGFSLEAPIQLEGDISLEMSSGNEAGSTMTLTGSITGSSNIKVKNTRGGDANISKVWLGGDNSNYSGDWDITTAPSNPDGSAGIVGASANAYGTGKISVGAKNFAQFDHISCVSNKNSLILATGAKAIVNTDIVIESITIAGTKHTSGVLNASSHPDYIEGSGSITLTPNGLSSVSTVVFQPYYKNGILYIQEQVKQISIYSLDGTAISNNEINSSTLEMRLPNGIYIIKADSLLTAKITVAE